MGQEIGAAPLGPANRSRTRRAISRVRRRRLRDRSRLGGGWRIDVEGLNSIFSLSPSGGEGRGEGANVASHSKPDSLHDFPLTLTLSPKGERERRSLNHPPHVRSHLSEQPAHSTSENPNQRTHNKRDHRHLPQPHRKRDPDD